MSNLSAHKTEASARQSQRALPMGLSTLHRRSSSALGVGALLLLHLVLVQTEGHERQALVIADDDEVTLCTPQDAVSHDREMQPLAAGLRQRVIDQR